MLPHDLSHLDSSLEAAIRTFAVQQGLSNDNVEPILDGICSAQKYLSSPLKVMWILKEPYDDLDSNGNPCGGGWSIPKDLFAIPGKYTKDKTSRVVTYTTHCILSGKTWDETPNIKDDVSVCDELQQIAYINLSKMPAKTKTSDAELAEKYKLWKNIVLKQIKVYDPEVLIFGSTISFMSDDIFAGKKYTSVNVRDLVMAHNVDGKLFLNCYHPGQLNVSEQDYCESILEAIRLWKAGKI